MNLTAGQAVEEFHYRGTQSLMNSVWSLFLAGQTPEQVKAFLKRELQHHPAALRGQTRLVDECYATFKAESPELAAQLEQSSNEAPQPKRRASKFRRLKSNES